MKISKKSYYFITALFLLMPFSVNYKLILFGNYTTGVVVNQKKAVSLNLMNSDSYTAFSVIRFETERGFIEFLGPEELKYPLGKEVKIIYHPNAPEKFVMFNFAGVVLNKKMIFPFVMLVLWLAFYLAIRDSQPKDNKDSYLIRYKRAIEKKSD